MCRQVTTRARAPPPPGGHGRQAEARAAIGHITDRSLNQSVNRLCVVTLVHKLELVPHANGRSVAVAGLRVLEIGDLGSPCPEPAHAWRLVWPGCPDCRRGQG